MVVENCLLDKGGGGSHALSPLLVKSYFARDVSLEICFCVILQAIQNIFGPSTPRILTRALEKF